MRIRINHRTSYRYAQPAAGVIQLLRLLPGEHDGQHILDWRLDADVDGHLRESRDAFGNRVAIFYAERPVQAITLAVTGEADVTDTAGLIRAHETLPAMVYLRSTELTAPGPALAELTAPLAGATPLDALHALNRALHGGMAFDTDATHAQTTAAAAYAARRGVCQDFAHIFIAAARGLGIPARYVSGHLARDARQEAAHAWAEAMVPDLGWVAFDPANGICPTDSYLRVAIGLDYLDAAPIRGARRGGGDESLTVSVDADAVIRQSQG